jgi:hypothetical protein
MYGVLCERCGEHLDSSTLSIFNCDLICIGCEVRERKHKLYRLAWLADRLAHKNGNLNFQGIGLPHDITRYLQ